MPKDGRSQFELADDKKIYHFLIDQLEKKNPLVKQPYGNAIWKLAEKKRITKHSYQSMLGRFKRKLWPSLDRTVLLTKEEKTYLKANLFQNDFRSTANGNAAANSRVVEEVDLSGDNDEEEKKGPSNDGNGNKSSEEEDEENDDGDNESGDDGVKDVSMANDNDENRSDGHRENEQIVAADEPMEAGKSKDVVSKKQGNGVSHRNRVLEPQANEQKQQRVKKFTKDEDVSLLKFFVDELETHNPNAYEGKFGNQLWELAEERGITQYSALSMRDRFRKYLFPHLADLDYVPDDTRQYIADRMKMMGTTPNGQDPKKKSRKKPIDDENPRLESGGRTSTGFKRGKYRTTNDERRKDLPAISHAAYSSAKVRSILFGMVLDGTLSDTDQMTNFSGKVDKLLQLADAYKVPLTGVLEMAESLKSGSKVRDALDKKIP